MALSANVVWEVRTDGHDDNGGGFVTGASGTDRSQQASPHVTIDGATITATVHTTTTQLNIVGYTVIAGDVGNIVNINGGTMTAGIYQITAVDTGNNRWTIDRSGGTAGQTGTGRMGGAIASIGTLGARVNAGVANQHAYIRSGTYTLTSSSANVSGGVYLNTVNISCCIIGYNSAGGRTDLSAGPTVDVGAITSVTVFGVNNASNSGVGIVNVTVDGQGNASIIAFHPGPGNTQSIITLLCRAIDCTTGFNGAPPNTRFVGCKAEGCTTGFTVAASGLCHRCWADGCTTGFTHTQSIAAHIDCVASDCTTPFVNGAGMQGLLWINCTADGGSGNDGISANALGNAVIASVLSSNSLYGSDLNGSMTFAYLVALFSNTSGEINAAANGQTINLGAVTLSGDPYVDAAADDYRPDATASEGASLRAAGLDVFGQTDNRDIGAVQHSDPAGGGDPAARTVVIQNIGTY